MYLLLPVSCPLSSLEMDLVTWKKNYTYKHLLYIDLNHYIHKARYDRKYSSPSLVTCIVIKISCQWILLEKSSLP